MAESSVGPGGDYVNLTAWDTGVDGTGGTQIAELTGDFTDNLTMVGWLDPADVTIRSDTVGVKRTVTSASLGGDMILAEDVDIATLTLQDIILDGNGVQAASKDCLKVTLGVTTLTLDRCKFVSSTEDGVQINAFHPSDTTVINADNCIFKDNVGAGYLMAKTNETVTATFRNCLFVGNGTHGQDTAVNANNTTTLHNCLSFGNTGDDFGDGSTVVTTNVLYCVSEDGSATVGHDDMTGSVSGKTDTTAYFTDYAGGDYTLKQSDVLSWEIEGDDSTTPATDYNYTTRATNSIGPYEFPDGTPLIGGSLALDIPQNMARSLDTRIN